MSENAFEDPKVNLYEKGYKDTSCNDSPSI